MIRRGRVMGGGSNFRNLIRFQGAHPLIKSAQRAAIALNGVSSNTATLSPAVDPNNSLLFYTGADTNSSSTSPATINITLTFTNGTTITASKSNTTGNHNVNFEVIEFWPGVLRSVQRGTISHADTSSTGSATLATTLQSITKAWASQLGQSSASTDGTPDDRTFHLVLTNTTTVTSTRVGTAGAFTIAFQVAEFF